MIPKIRIKKLDAEYQTWKNKWEEEYNFLMECVERLCSWDLEELEKKLTDEELGNAVEQFTKLGKKILEFKKLLNNRKQKTQPKEDEVKQIITSKEKIPTAPKITLEEKKEDKKTSAIVNRPEEKIDRTQNDHANEKKVVHLLQNLIHIPNEQIKKVDPFAIKSNDEKRKLQAPKEVKKIDTEQFKHLNELMSVRGRMVIKKILPISDV